MKKFLLIILLFSFVSCSKEEAPKEGIIPKEYLAKIIADVQKAQALVNTKQDSNLTIRSIRIKDYNEEILKKHKVSEEKYNKSIDYYSSNQKEFSALMELVSKKLN